MAAFAWVTMGLAVWHFAIFVPDRFWGGIVGAFVAAIVGAALFGFLVAGLTVPGQDDTGIGQALIAVPGSLIGLGLSYLYGARIERSAGATG